MSMSWDDAIEAKHAAEAKQVEDLLTEMAGNGFGDFGYDEMKAMSDGALKKLRPQLVDHMDHLDDLVDHYRSNPQMSDLMKNTQRLWVQFAGAVDAEFRERGIPFPPLDDEDDAA